MRRISSLLLLVIFLLGIAGSYPLFKAAQYNVRKEIKALIKQTVPETELKVIIIDENDNSLLRWERKGKEFWYRNSLYDVIRFEKKHGKITYFCIDDTQEAQLFANLDKLVKNHKKTSGLAQNFLKLLTCSYLPARVFYLCSPSFSKTAFFIPPLKNYSFSYSRSFFPPPENRLNVVVF